MHSKIGSGRAADGFWSPAGGGGRSAVQLINGTDAVFAGGGGGGGGCGQNLCYAGLILGTLMIGDDYLRN